MKHYITLFLAGLLVVNGYPKQRLYLDSFDYSALQDNTRLPQDQTALQKEQKSVGDFGINYIERTDDQVKPYKLGSQIGPDWIENLVRYRRGPFGVPTKVRVKG